MSISTIYFHASTRLVLGILILYSTMMSLGTTMKIDPDGGYTDLVVRISSDGSVPENNCPKILYNLKVSAQAKLLLHHRGRQIDYGTKM